MKKQSENFLLKEKLSFLKNKYLLKKKKYKKIKKNYSKKIKFEKYKLNKYLKKNCKIALKDIIFSLLPVIDNIERALKSFNKKLKFSKNFKKKLKNILSMFLKTFFKFNIKLIKKKNVLFNPKIHQAVLTKKSNIIKKNYIIKILQKGYLLNDFLLRPAMVIVSSKY